MAITNEKINKIMQPQDEYGWTTQYLENFNFCFWNNKIIKTNWRKVLEILNKDLPFFYYYTAINQFYINGIFQSSQISQIIIDDDIIQKIATDSIKGTNYLFSKNILTYSGFIHNLNTKSEFNKKLKLKKEADTERELKEKNKQLLFLTKKKESEDAILINQQGGIYSIYSISDIGVEKIEYIGLTTRPCMTRWNEHLDVIYGRKSIPDGMEKLYLLLQSKQNNYGFYIKLIVDFDKTNTIRPLTQNEKEAIEYGFIYAIQPPGNTEGIDIPYYFTDSNEQRYLRTG